MKETLGIELPSRDSKPRQKGLTSVIDAGVPFDIFDKHVTEFSHLIDFVKFGWGTALVTPSTRKKMERLKALGIGYWMGGTLFEVACLQGVVDRYVDWAEDLGCEYFEISDGSIELPTDEKLGWIERLSKRFHVLSEVGSKDEEDVMSPSEWGNAIAQETKAGAWKVIAEGRESGTAGIYRTNGEVRFGLIKELAQFDIDFDTLFFEAPKKAQQVWFMKWSAP